MASAVPSVTAPRACKSIMSYPEAWGGSVDNPMNLICLCWRCHNAAHGSMCCDIPAGATPEELRRLHATVMADMEQACVEYVSDHYAEQGEPWSPW